MKLLGMIDISIGGIKSIQIELNRRYHQKERDPLDLIDYVVPISIEGGKVTYREYYKDRWALTTTDTCPVNEFNFWFRRGM